MSKPIPKIGMNSWLDFGLYRSALSRRKQGFESPRERHVICSVLYFQNLSGLFV
jgi:hypothetical protein